MQDNAIPAHLLLPPPTTTDLTYDIPEDLNYIYNGTAQGIGEVIATEPHYTVTAVYYNGSTTIPTKAGTYTVTADIAANPPYSPATGLVLGEYTIAKKEVTITGVSASNKEYNGNVVATVTGTAVVNGKVGDDVVTVTNGTASFSDKNVGTGKTVTFTGFSLGGADAGNYTLTAQPANVTANITPKALTITGVTATAREFAANNLKVALTGGSLVGIETGDVVTFTLGEGTIASDAIGENKAVTTAITLTGTNAGNYTLTQPTNVTVTISSTNSIIAALPAMPISSNTKIEIYNLRGERIYIGKGVLHTPPSLNAGIYIVKAGNQTQKIIVK